jgi:hypothetical protein
MRRFGFTGNYKPPSRPFPRSRRSLDVEALRSSREANFAAAIKTPTWYALTLAAARIDPNGATHVNCGVYKVRRKRTRSSCSIRSIQSI